MAKQGEKEYLKNVGELGVRHSYNKPFSDNECGGNLLELGAVMSILPPPPAKLLDLGCGAGWTSVFFAKRGYDVTGQDISSDMIEQARKKAKAEGLDNVRFVVCDYEDMNFDAEFNCAVFFDSLHHAVNEEEALNMVYRALKPNGICVTSEPGIWHERNKKTIEAVKKYNVTEKDTPPIKVIRLGKKIGFRNFQIYPHAKSLNLYMNTGLGVYTKNIFRFSAIRNLSTIFKILVFKRFDGLVSMVK